MDTSLTFKNRCAPRGLLQNMSNGSPISGMRYLKESMYVYSSGADGGTVNGMLKKFPVRATENGALANGGTALSAQPDNTAHTATMANIDFLIPRSLVELRSMPICGRPVNT